MQTIPVANLHCTSCVHTIERTLHALSPTPLSGLDVSVASKSISLRLSSNLPLPHIRAALDDAGFDLMDAPLSPMKLSKHVEQCSLCQHTAQEIQSDTPHKVVLSIGGMTCTSCVTTITEAVSRLPGTSDIGVNLLGHSATLRIDRKAIIPSVTDAIDECGYDVDVISADPIAQSVPAGKPVAGSDLRKISLRVNGMYCQNCPGKVMGALSDLSPKIIVTKPITDYANPIAEISYEPLPPQFTLRTIISRIASADPSFTTSPYYPPTLEQRTRSVQLHEQSTILKRLLFTFVVAIPTFIIGIVYMSLVPSDNPSKKYLMEPMWGGNASRIQWSLFFLATPVMFYSALLFHVRSIKEIVSMWRKGSSTPMVSRFTKFGSMNLLVSTGVSIAYFASIALLALAASRPPASTKMGDTTTYFDSVVFLSLFLLCGRCIDAYSKARTADAITALGSLRPAEALLVTPRSPSDEVSYPSLTKTDPENGDAAFDNGDISIAPGFKIKKVSIDLLEIGDIVRVLNGATPPSDSTIVAGAETSFDESSLTGEAKPIKKIVGDRVFLGTINKGKPVEVRVDAVGGVTMLDHIIRIVCEGQARRAPIERIADAVTSIFVPIITVLAIITWVIWLSLGFGGRIPRDYLDITTGGWTVWSLQFAIAVFVVACPCGIGLAAPTALLVGSGLAAKFGILARGGGEAFQEMAQVDVVAFDKTGTLTKGGEPQVSDFEIVSGTIWMHQTILGIAAELESGSSHPLGMAIKEYAVKHGAAQSSAFDFDEVPGRGVKAHFNTLCCMALIGNEAMMKEHGVILDSQIVSRLTQWATDAKSIVLLAVKDDSAEFYSLVAMFAVTDTLRPEASSVIRLLHEKGIKTWMISGDNEVTAKAVARSVGIPEMNVLAGVLPHQKAEKIEWLQRNGPKRAPSRWQKLLGRKGMNAERCIVSMVGDGINDAPALAASDVGVAIGSGSDIAISSASFVLVSSNLKSFLILCDLSRRVLNRVKLNFMWAFVYNIVMVPIAAGVIYPAGHARLPPVWASLAMALSSISVVCSSLLLKLYKEPKD